MQQALYEVACVVQIRRDAVGGFVSLEDIEAEWKRRASELGFTSEISNVLEQTPEDHL